MHLVFIDNNMNPDQTAPFRVHYVCFHGSALGDGTNMSSVIFNFFPSTHDSSCLLSHLLMHLHGSHRLEKHLNLECFLEKSLKFFMP